jgi:hypothetical protein
VVHLRKDTDHVGQYLNVYNNMTEKMKAVADRMPLQKLANAVLASEEKDTNRGNKCIDVGFASDLNSKRNN